MSKQLPAALLDLRKWDQLSCEECVEVALQVERMLPLPFQFFNLETYSSASEQHHVAYFTWNALPGPSLTCADFQLDPVSLVPGLLISMPMRICNLCLRKRENTSRNG